METQQYILVVEDDEALRKVLMAILGAYGYAVVTAATVREAEATMQEFGPTAIGLVISDVNLASDGAARGGYTLYQRWTTAHPTLPYLLISGDRTNTALPAIHDGVVAFLAKPFDLNELLDTVQALLSAHIHDHAEGCRDTGRA
jgi:DNA-binding NtrC family response regulator